MACDRCPVTKSWNLQLFGLAKVFLIGGGAPAISANVFRGSNQFFVLFQMQLDEPDILKVTKVLFMTGVRHFLFSHFVSP